MNHKIYIIGTTCNNINILHCSMYINLSSLHGLDNYLLSQEILEIFRYFESISTHFNFKGVELRKVLPMIGESWKTEGKWLQILFIQIEIQFTWINISHFKGSITPLRRVWSLIMTNNQCLYDLKHQLVLGKFS